MTGSVMAPDRGSDNAGSAGSLAPTIVRASAGTGKTYQLTARLLRILLQGAAPESILATTFTRKAAGEILTRVMSDLAAAADPRQPDALEKLRDQVGLPTLPRSAAAELLVTVMRGVHRLRICTLDSLFSQLARSFAFELDLPPGWRLSDEIEEMMFQSAAVGQMVGQMDPGQTSTILAMLAKGENKRSIARELIAVVSGTYALSRTADHAGWQTLRPPKSPIDRDDVWDAVADGLRGAAEATEVKRHKTKLTSLADLFADRMQDKLVGDGLVSKIGLAHGDEMPVFYSKPFAPEARPGFDALYGLAKTVTMGQLVGQNEATGRVLAMYAAAIESIKREAAVLSFDDVSVRLARGLSAVDPVLLESRMDGTVDHLLLDEFQDTSPVQWSVLRPMAAHASDVGHDDVDGNNDETKTVHRSFFCVGDTKQAIYGWRGGVAEIFDAVADQIPGLDQRSQDLSYRSSPIITEVVNDVFRNLTRHKIADADPHPASADHHESVAVKSFATRFPRHQTARTDLPGRFEFRTAAKVEGASAERSAAVFDAATRRIVTMGQSISADVDGGVGGPKTIGVLTRTNAAVGEMIRRLGAAGVDVSQEGGNPLTDSAAVQMLLSALMMTEHPGDRRWAFHLSQSPISADEGWTAPRIRRMIADVGLVVTLRQLADRLAPIAGPHDTLRMRQLMILAIDHGRNPMPRIRDFVELVRVKKVARPRPAMVRVMTVHQSKGLEFDAVVLPQISGELVRPSTDPVADHDDLTAPPRGLSRSLPRSDWHFLPRRWQEAFGNHAAGKMTEALCLMYVAMTRSRQALVLVAEPHAKMADKKTVAGLVAASLRCESTGDGEAVLAERGEELWWR